MLLPAAEAEWISLNFTLFRQYFLYLLVVNREEKELFTV